MPTWSQHLRKIGPGSYAKSNWKQNHEQTTPRTPTWTPRDARGMPRRAKGEARDPKWTSGFQHSAPARPRSPQGSPGLASDIHFGVPGYPSIYHFGWHHPFKQDEANPKQTNRNTNSSKELLTCKNRMRLAHAHRWPWALSPGNCGDR